MVRLRCPECGYLQTLSEERFLSISDDYLNCPHCHSRVPKQWEPETEEAVPDEVRHKMHAFSRRILNGGNISREVVHALESLVRRHGPADESNKALGIGYAHLGEDKKAEAFLIQALEQEPNDAETLHSLLDVLFSQEKYGDAAKVGSAIVNILGQRTPDEDVAYLALALAELDRKEDAEALLDSFPDLDPRNAVVKRARKELHRGASFQLANLFRESGPLHRLLRRGRREGARVLSDEPPIPDPTPAAAGAADAPAPDYGEERRISSRPQVPSKKLEKLRATLEYWIYAPDAAMPGWEDVKNGLARQQSRKAEQERVIKLLESLMDRNDLTVDYILRSQADELFDYPEDLIPQNSRDLGEDDREALLNSQMIVRLRLSLANYSGVDGLIFMVRFVEAVRELTGGVVQDAISHTLWGTEQWQSCVLDPKKNLLETHVQFEALDENGVVWIHTHGMQKFGLPDLELEGVPSDIAPTGLHLMILVGETLIAARDTGLDVSSPLSVPNRPIVFTVLPQPRDEEGHFAAGSLKILPHVSGADPDDPNALIEVLASLRPSTRSTLDTGRRSQPPDTQTRTEDESDVAQHALKERLLNAHREARADLQAFKKSFQQNRITGEALHAVKVGFPTQGGEYEWMWVSLDAWRGKSMVGRVENTPVLRKDLHKGSRVQLSEGQIFDWVITRGEEILKGPFTEGILN